MSTPTVPDKICPMCQQTYREHCSSCLACPGRGHDQGCEK